MEEQWVVRRIALLPLLFHLLLFVGFVGFAVPPLCLVGEEAFHLVGDSFRLGHES